MVPVQTMRIFSGGSRIVSVYVRKTEPNEKAFKNCFLKALKLS